MCQRTSTPTCETFISPHSTPTWTLRRSRYLKKLAPGVAPIQPYRSAGKCSKPGWQTVYQPFIGIRPSQMARSGLCPSMKEKESPREQLGFVGHLVCCWFLFHSRFTASGMTGLNAHLEKRLDSSGTHGFFRTEARADSCASLN